MNSSCTNSDNKSGGEKSIFLMGCIVVRIVLLVDTYRHVYLGTYTDQWMSSPFSPWDFIYPIGPISVDPVVVILALLLMYNHIMRGHRVWYCNSYIAFPILLGLYVYNISGLLLGFIMFVFRYQILLMSAFVLNICIISFGMHYMCNSNHEKRYHIVYTDVHEMSQII